MSKIIINHALEVSPEAIWYPYVRKQLAAQGNEVVILPMPDPNAPQAEAWLAVLAREVAQSKPADTVLVGHSLGGVNILRYLQQYNLDKMDPFAGVVLVATMVHPVGYDALNSFFEPAFDWATIRKTAKNFRALTALDDPVLSPDPLEHVRLMLEGTEGAATITATGGHFPIWSPDVPPVLPELPEVVRLVQECLGSHNKIHETKDYISPRE